MHRIAVTGAILTILVMAAGCSSADKLNSQDPAQRIEGLRALRNAPAPSAAEKVAALVGDPDAKVAEEAVRTLGTMRSTVAAEALAKTVLDNKQGSVRREAALAMGRRTDESCATALRRVVQVDPDAVVRSAAALSLGRSKDGKDMVCLLQVADNDPDPGVRAQAVGAVEQRLQMTFGYDPNASADERRDVVERVRFVIQAKKMDGSGASSQGGGT